MELDELHVLQRHSRSVRDRHPVPCLYHPVGRKLVYPPPSPPCDDDSGGGDEGESARPMVQGHKPLTCPTVAVACKDNPLLSPDQARVRIQVLAHVCYTWQ